MLTQQSNITQALSVNTTITMTSLEIAELVESRHDNVRIAIHRLVDKGVITLPAMQVKPTAGRPMQVYVFSGEQGKRDSIIVVAQLSPEFTARLVDRWQELEQGIAVIPQSLPEALRLAADLAEKNERLAIERDHAIATKAQIGSKREATAMATAAKHKREAEKLKHELGFSSRHATILQVQSATGFDVGFVPLRRWCKENGVSAVTVPDKRFPKGVKAWPAEAWAAVYGISLADLFGGGVA
ncbi:MAG: hypothetical protein AB7U63_12420 [Porticoccaceae bacterium]